MKRTAIIMMLALAPCVQVPLNAQEVAPVAVSAEARPYSRMQEYPNWGEMTADALREEAQQTIAEMEEGLRKVQSISPEETTWENTFLAYSNAIAQVEYLVNAMGVLMAVQDDVALKTAAEEVMTELRAAYAQAHTDAALWGIISQAAASEWAQKLSAEQRFAMQKIRNEFLSCGAALTPHKRARVLQIEQEIGALQFRFNENLQKSSAHCYVLIEEDFDRLRAMPAYMMEVARESAQQRGIRHEAYEFSLQNRTLVELQRYCEDEEIRKQAWQAEQLYGNTPEYDNAAVIMRCLELRHELAGLFGYACYADYAAQKRMMPDGAAALAFVDDMMTRVQPAFRRECAEMLRIYNAQTGKNVDALPPWDVVYAVNLLRQAQTPHVQYDISSYLMVDGVLHGALALYSDLLGLEFLPLETQYVPDGHVGSPGAVPVWHPDVLCYEVRDRLSGETLGAFYLDLYARKDKRRGAWMAPIRQAEPTTAGHPRSVRHLHAVILNLMPGGKLMSLAGVEGLFHELGHVMHAMLGRGVVREQGFMGVEQDFVELPSQMSEYWARHPEVLARFARHYKTGKPYPREELGHLCHRKSPVAAIEIMVQLRVARVDLEMNLHYAEKFRGKSFDAASHTVIAAWDVPQIAGKVSPMRTVLHCMYPLYGAGYYAYIWSDVMAADAFEQFERSGVLNPATGAAYRRTLLQPGSSAPAAELFRNFTGHAPDPEAYLRRLGILSSPNHQKP